LYLVKGLMARGEAIGAHGGLFVAGNKPMRVREAGCEQRGRPTGSLAYGSFPGLSMGIAEEADMRDILMRLVRDEEGPTAVEYAILVWGIAMLILGAVYAFGGKVSAKLDGVANTLDTKF
jgi:Flp pilus assembly pilin Flp